MNCFILFWQDFAGDSFWQASLPVKVLVLQEVAQFEGCVQALAGMGTLV